MSKFYAVAIGKTLGVFRSWKECEANIKGWPKALYKSFPTHAEALEFVKRTNPDFNDGTIQLKFPIPSVLTTVSANTGVTATSVVLDRLNWCETEPYVYKHIEPYKVTENTPGYTEYGKNYDRYCKNLLGGWDSRQVMIYIDGSKMPSINHRGSGAYVRYRGNDYSLSVPFNAEVAKKYEFTPAEIEKLSSPSMEYLALAEVLWRLLALRLPEANGFAKPVSPRLRLIFVGDYNGVKNFSEGNWKIKEVHIAKIHRVCSAIQGWLKLRGIDLVFVHVNGHVGILGNEYSDTMAKKTVATDTILDWVRILGSDLSSEM
jgi:ribonuclease HI